MEANRKKRYATDNFLQSNFVPILKRSVSF